MSRSMMQYRCLKSLINLSIDIMTPQTKIRRCTGAANTQCTSLKSIDKEHRPLTYMIMKSCI
jgi:hypothetical protein